MDATSTPSHTTSLDDLFTNYSAGTSSSMPSFWLDENYNGFTHSRPDGQSMATQDYNLPLNLGQDFNVLPSHDKHPGWLSGGATQQYHGVPQVVAAAPTNVRREDGFQARPYFGVCFNYADAMGSSATQFKPAFAATPSTAPHAKASSSTGYGDAANAPIVPSKRRTGWHMFSEWMGSHLDEEEVKAAQKATAPAKLTWVGYVGRLWTALPQSERDRWLAIAKKHNLTGGEMVIDSGHRRKSGTAKKKGKGKGKGKDLTAGTENIHNYADLDLRRSPFTPRSHDTGTEWLPGSISETSLSNWHGPTQDIPDHLQPDSYDIGYPSMSTGLQDDWNGIYNAYLQDRLDRKAQEEHEVLQKINQLAIKHVFDHYFDDVLPQNPALQTSPSTWSPETKSLHESTVNSSLLTFITSVLDGTSPTAARLLPPPSTYTSRRSFSGGSPEGSLPTTRNSLPASSKALNNMSRNFKASGSRNSISSASASCSSKTKVAASTATSLTFVHAQDSPLAQISCIESPKSGFVFGTGLPFDFTAPSLPAPGLPLEFRSLPTRGPITSSVSILPSTEVNSDTLATSSDSTHVNAQSVPQPSRPQYSMADVDHFGDSFTFGQNLQMPFDFTAPSRDAGWPLEFSSLEDRRATPSTPHSPATGSSRTSAYSSTLPTNNAHTPPDASPSGVDCPAAGSSSASAAASTTHNDANELTQASTSATDAQAGTDVAPGTDFDQNFNVVGLGNVDIQTYIDVFDALGLPHLLAPPAIPNGVLEK